MTKKLAKKVQKSRSKQKNNRLALIGQKDHRSNFEIDSLLFSMTNLLLFFFSFRHFTIVLYQESLMSVAMNSAAQLSPIKSIAFFGREMV